MAEEGNVAKVVAQSTKMVEAVIDRGSDSRSVLTTEERLQEEAGTLLRSPNDASPRLVRVEDSTVYQADVVEGAAGPADETTAATTEKPADAEASSADTPTSTPDAAAAAEGETDTAAAAAATTAAASADPVAATEAAAEGGAAVAPAEAAATPSSSATEVPASTGEAAAEAGTPTAAPAEGGAVQVSAEQKAASTSPTGAAEVHRAGGSTAPTTAASTASPAAAKKDPYAIEIPLDKKINKRTQRKLWEEIEKRKPLIPKHVAQHIQKYAKPPFETWSCKFRGKSSCFGCR